MCGCRLRTHLLVPFSCTADSERAQAKQLISEALPPRQRLELTPAERESIANREGLDRFHLETTCLLTVSQAMLVGGSCGSKVSEPLQKTLCACHSFISFFFGHFLLKCKEMCVCVRACVRFSCGFCFMVFRLLVSGCLLSKSSRDVSSWFYTNVVRDHFPACWALSASSSKPCSRPGDLCILAFSLWICVWCLGSSELEVTQDLGSCVVLLSLELG